MKTRTAFWAGSASAFALTAGACAFAQDSAADDVIIVQGIRGSLQQSLDAKRNADAVIEVITAEDIGKFPDKNVAESLQRITGVSIRRDFGEGERVSIRGASANQNLTQLNGHAVATADWFILDQLAASRSFNFLLLPSEIVGSLEVFKSTQANIDAGGIGGTINVHTRNPLDLDNFVAQASFQGAYNDLAGDIDPYASGMLSWKNDAGTLGLLVAGTFQKRSLRRDGFEILGYSQNAIADQGGAVLDTPSLIGSALFEQERIRKGGNFTLAFRPSDSLDVSVNGLWSEMKANNFNQNYLAWVSQTLGAGVQPTNTVVGADGTLLAGTFAFNAGSNGVVYDAILRDANTRTRSLDIDVNYAASDTLRFHAKVGYTDAFGRTTNEPFFETNAPTGFSFDLTQRAPQVSFTDIDPASAADLSNMVVGWSANNKTGNDDEEFFVYADVEKDVEFGAINRLSAGVKFAAHERSLDTINGQRRSIINRIDPACNATEVCSLADVAGELTPSDFLQGVAVPGSLTSFIQVDPVLLQALHDRLVIDPTVNVGNMLDTQFTGIGNSETFNPASVFTIQEDTIAGYVMGEFEADRLRGNFGVRVTSTEQTVDNFTGGVGAGVPGVLISPFGTFVAATQNKRHTDVLPSINFVFDVTDTLLLRGAAGRSLARPDYNLLGGSVSTTALLLTGTGGNFNLEPIRANNYDLALEWYPDDDSIFALGFFYKDFSSAVINDTVISQQILEVGAANDPRVTNPANNCTPAGGTLVFNCDFALSVPTNSAGYAVQGIEANVQKALPGGFGFLGNFTFSDADEAGGSPVPENSKYSGNATVYYENDLLSARLTYTYRSSYFINVDRGRELFSAATDSLDASVSFNVMDNLALTVDATNLLNEKLYQYHDNPDKPARLYENGRWVFFGARFSY